MKNRTLSASTKLLFCDECHYYHAAASDCPYSPIVQTAIARCWAQAIEYSARR